jgi:hypothetical protein
MKHRIVNLVLLCSIVWSCQTKKESNEHDHQSPSTSLPADTLKKSIPREEHVQIGKAHAMIKYHAPAVRGRTIWGGLVPYGEVWVTGAHQATSFEINRDFIVSGTRVAAGKYALFTIPREDTWTVILNTNWDQHLTDEYDSKDDVVRVEASPEYVPALQERLKYSIVPNGDNAGKITMRWEKISISLPFEVQ